MIAACSCPDLEPIVLSHEDPATQNELAIERAELEAEWLSLTREDLPGLAERHRWPIRLDHCFQRVLLDHSCNGVWYDFIIGRPAYKAAGIDILKRAVELGRMVARGDGNLRELNRQSLIWRGKVGLLRR